MNYDTNSEPTPNTVSTVTKHIKIYSDNPIHDCIDRAIDACAGLDSQDEDGLFYADRLHKAAQDLAYLSLGLWHRHNDKYK